MRSRPVLLQGTPELPNKHKPGFTLVELMIAFSLSVLTIILSISLFSQAGHTSGNVHKKQMLQDISNRLLRLIQKDIRSSTEAFISLGGIKLKVYQLSESGLPESQEIFYEFTESGVIRKEGDKAKDFPIANFLQKKDYWSICTTPSVPDGTGFFLEIFAVDSTGEDLIRMKERLIKIDITKN